MKLIYLILFVIYFGLTFQVLSKTNEISFQSSDIPNNLYSGKIITGKKWSDKNGTNIFIISIKTVKSPTDFKPFPYISKEIHGYHYHVEKSNFTLIREVKDFELKCPHDNVLKYAESSLNLTDLDNDNIGEISFVYYLGCFSEASPLNMKFIFLENGDKYAIRGSDVLPFGNRLLGGKTEIDPSYNNGPIEFLNFSKEIWKKYQNKYNK